MQAPDYTAVGQAWSNFALAAGKIGGDAVQKYQDLKETSDYVDQVYNKAKTLLDEDNPTIMGMPVDKGILKMAIGDTPTDEDKANPDKWESKFESNLQKAIISTAVLNKHAATLNDANSMSAPSGATPPAPQTAAPASTAPNPATAGTVLSDISGSDVTQPTPGSNSASMIQSLTNPPTALSGMNPGGQPYGPTQDGGNLFSEAAGAPPAPAAPNQTLQSLRNPSAVGAMAQAPAAAPVATPSPEPAPSAAVASPAPSVSSYVSSLSPDHQAHGTLLENRLNSAKDFASKNPNSDAAMESVSNRMKDMEDYAKKDQAIQDLITEAQKKADMLSADTKYTVDGRVAAETAAAADKARKAGATAANKAKTYGETQKNALYTDMNAADRPNVNSYDEDNFLKKKLAYNIYKPESPIYGTPVGEVRDKVNSIYPTVKAYTDAALKGPTALHGKDKYGNEINQEGIMQAFARGMLGLTTDGKQRTPQEIMDLLISQFGSNVAK